jgi:hypothetical protein
MMDVTSKHPLLLNSIERAVNHLSLPLKATSGRVQCYVSSKVGRFMFHIGSKNKRNIERYNAFGTFGRIPLVKEKAF